MFFPSGMTGREPSGSWQLSKSPGCEFCKYIRQNWGLNRRSHALATEVSGYVPGAGASERCVFVLEAQSS